MSHDVNTNSELSEHRGPRHAWQCRMTLWGSARLATTFNQPVVSYLRPSGLVLHHESGGMSPSNTSVFVGNACSEMEWRLHDSVADLEIRTLLQLLFCKRWRWSTQKLWRGPRRRPRQPGPMMLATEQHARGDSLSLRLSGCPEPSLPQSVLLKCRLEPRLRQCS